VNRVNKITYHVLTLFPQMIAQAVNHSVIGRGINAGLIELNIINIRDYAENKHAQADDAPYGGGPGMIMTAQPIYNAYKSIGKPAGVVYFSPQGRVLTQPIVESYSVQNDVILLCGHYEGVDERLIEEIVTDEISIGDYVLTGGELPALVFIDAVSRLVPGVLGKEESFRNESFSGEFANMLEHPHYTRPAVWNGRSVPEVLLSGHHGKIMQWRREQAIKRTKIKRPDL